MFRVSATHVDSVASVIPATSVTHVISAMFRVSKTQEDLVDSVILVTFVTLVT